MVSMLLHALAGMLWLHAESALIIYESARAVRLATGTVSAGHKPRVVVYKGVLRMCMDCSPSVDEASFGVRSPCENHRVCGQHDRSTRIRQVHGYEWTSAWVQ